MITNTITEEIRTVRQQLAAEFDNDIKQIVADVIKRQTVSGRKYIRLEKRIPFADTSNTTLPTQSEYPVEY